MNHKLSLLAATAVIVAVISVANEAGASSIVTRDSSGMFFEPHYQAIHSQADDLRGLDPQALTRLFKRSNGIIRLMRRGSGYPSDMVRLLRSPGGMIRLMKKNAPVEEVIDDSDTEEVCWEEPREHCTEQK